MNKRKFAPLITNTHKKFPTYGIVLILLTVCTVIFLVYWLVIKPDIERKIKIETFIREFGND